MFLLLLPQNASTRDQQYSLRSAPRTTCTGSLHNITIPATLGNFHAQHASNCTAARVCGRLKANASDAVRISTSRCDWLQAVPQSSWPSPTTHHHHQCHTHHVLVPLRIFIDAGVAIPSIPPPCASFACHLVLSSHPISQRTSTLSSDNSSRPSTMTAA